MAGPETPSLRVFCCSLHQDYIIQWLAWSSYQRKRLTDIMMMALCCQHTVISSLVTAIMSSAATCWPLVAMMGRLSQTVSGSTVDMTIVYSAGKDGEAS